MKKFIINTITYQEYFKPLLEKHKWNIQWALHTPSSFRTWFEVECSTETKEIIINDLKIERANLDHLISKFNGE